MKKLLIILAVTTFIACNKSNDTIDAFYLGSGLEFSISNANNEDLLNPENPNKIDTESIRIFYVINGEKVNVYNPNLTNSRNFLVFKHENEYRIGITLNHTETSEKPITYIQWNEGDTDTVEVVYNRTSNSVMQNIIWLNGEQVWEIGSNTVDPYFKLIK
ncbi:hypothetical protein [Lutibacter sp.]|uniref:hypothetical protein n=1 Tax=Lutibacter sp. TaxID=1925666 RepID=UPI0034A0AA48